MDKKLKKLLVGIYGFIFLFMFSVFAFAETTNPKINELTEKIFNANTDEQMYPAFEELMDSYFKENKYNECITFLESLGQKKQALEPQLDYYIGLTRYHQLKYLEQSQNWEEYFNDGNTYKEQVKANAEKVIAAVKKQDALAVYARLLLWMFYKDQDDASESQASADLISTTLEYAESATDLAPIKDVADRLVAYGARGKSAQLYKIYADKLVTSGVKDDDIKELADKFFKESNIELAQTFFDLYADRITKSMPKDKAAPILIEIAKKFIYKDQQACDPAYAEKIFTRIDQLGLKDVLDSNLLYTRAFNLEKAKEFALAKEHYVSFLNRFPSSDEADKANYKVGIISAFALRDIKSAKEYFQKLGNKEGANSYIIGSLYQLGVLNQWENAPDKAKDYYNKLVTLAKDNFAGTVAAAKQRLAEIEGGKPMEYNLKVFLDVSLKPENASFDMKNSQLHSSAYLSKKGQEIKINAAATMPESGCMQVETQYLWSGELGSATVTPEQASFATAFLDSGTKAIGLVVTSPNGFVDRGLEIIDVE